LKSSHQITFSFDTDSSVEEDERFKILVRALGILKSKKVRLLMNIISEKKLKTIAQRQIRLKKHPIKKFRAIKKLNKYLQKQLWIIRSG
jgi:hypothetical protein